MLTKMSSSVLAPDSDCRAEIGDCALGDDFAAIDDGDLIAKAFHHFENVRGEKNGGAVLNLFEQNVFHETRADSIDAFERFVH